MINNISNKIAVLLSLMACVGVIGCSNNRFELSDDTTTDDGYESTLPDGGYTNDDGSVQFSTMVWNDSDTRGTVVYDFEEGDDMGVYAYRLPSDGSINALEVSPNFMHNQLLTKLADGSWFYTPTKYWSNDENDTYLFFGYSPYSADEENTMYHSSINDTITYPVIVHSSPLEIADSRDLVLAGRKCSKYADDGEPTVVDLQFKHVLSRLRFEFRNDLTAEEDTYSMVVKSVKLVNATTLSAFTYEDDPDPQSETGLLLVEYVADEVQGTGTISGSIESGALIGKGASEEEEDNNCYLSSAYIPYYDINNNPDKYNTYTSIMPEDEYLFLDPYVIGGSRVMFGVEVEVYAQDINVTGDTNWVLALTNTAYLDVTELIVGTTVVDDQGTQTTTGGMERGGSYVWQISYMPIPGSALMVYVIEYWDDVYNKHDM
ncbi:MAG: fimbrillin family protein [Rikenellaceae bacterium]